MSKKTIRPPARKKAEKSTDRPPKFSIGDEELKILKHISKLPKNETFNRRGFARHFNVSPTTAYDRLMRLVAKKLVRKEHDGGYFITAKGKRALSVISKGSGKPQPPCRSEGRNNLSQHVNKFTLQITNKQKFNIDLLGADKIQPVPMQNWTYKILYFGEDTIHIYPNKILIYVEEIISKNTDDSLSQSVRRAIELADRLDLAGMQCEGIKLEKVHFARINSVLADVLFKRFDRYFVKLSSGRYFWIDQSDEKHDETNDIEMRDRLDDFLKDLPHSTSKLTDVDKMKEVLSMLIELRVMDMQQSQLMPSQKLERADYFG